MDLSWGEKILSIEGSFFVDMYIANIQFNERRALEASKLREWEAAVSHSLQSSFRTAVDYLYPFYFG